MSDSRSGSGFFSWLMLGAAAGGLITGSYRYLGPGWAWGLAGGVAGGLLGLAAGWLARRPWSLALRAAAAAAVLLFGLALLWYACGYFYVLGEVRRSINR